MLAGGLALLLATVGFFRRDFVSPEDDSVEIRELLTRDDIDYVGSPSWNGKYVPYRTVQAELWLYNIETSQSRRVRGHPDSIRTNFLWMVASPDGSQIAYLLEHFPGGGEVRILNSDGSDERVLLDTPRYGSIVPRSWSTDGRFIAAVGYLNDGSRDILTIDATTGEFQVLYNGSGPPMNAQVSPDGKWVAFHENQDVHLVSTAGGPAIDAVVHPAFEMVIGWTPDGRLAFFSDRSGQRDVWVVPIASNGTPGEPELRWKNLTAQPIGTTASGDLFYSDSRIGNDLYVADLDETGHFSSEPRLLPDTRYEHRNANPNYSPDGRSLAYTDQVNPQEVEIRIRDLATGRENVLPLAMSRVNDLRWYPDRSLLLLRGALESDYGFYRYDLDAAKSGTENVGSEDTSLLTRLGDAPPHTTVNPTFSTDGKYLYYLALPGRAHTTLSRLNLASGEVRVILDPPDGLLRMYSLSPDRKHLALDIRPPDSGFRDLLYTSDPTGGSRHLLTEAEEVRADGGLLWFRESAVLFHRPDPYAISLDDLVLVPLDGGPSEKLATMGAIVRMSLHPDGTQVILQTSGFTQHLTAIQNLFRPRPE